MYEFFCSKLRGCFMDFNERKQQILDVLEKHNGVSTIDNLCKRVYASRSTIRRDLIALEEEGLIKRSHGYVSINVTSANESPIGMRRVENLDKKQLIAGKAAPLIKDGMVIFLDSSSTVCQLAPILKTRQSITIITNGINIANELSNAGNLKCFLCPGVLKYKSLSIVGEFASNFIKNFSAELAFISCKAINTKGIFEGDDSQGLVKKSMIENTEKTVLLCDNTKENAVGFFKLSDLQNIDYLVSNGKFSGELNVALENSIQNII